MKIKYATTKKPTKIRTFDTGKQFKSVRGQLIKQYGELPDMKTWNKKALAGFQEWMERGVIAWFQPENGPIYEPAKKAGE